MPVVRAKMNVNANENGKTEQGEGGKFLLTNGLFIFSFAGFAQEQNKRRSNHNKIAF